MSIEVGKKYKARNGTEWIIEKESSLRGIFIGLNENGQQNLFRSDGKDWYEDVAYDLELGKQEQTVELKVEVDTTEAIDAIMALKEEVQNLAKVLNDVNWQLSRIHAKLGVQD